MPGTVLVAYLSAEKVESQLRKNGATILRYVSCRDEGPFQDEKQLLLSEEQAHRRYKSALESVQSPTPHNTSWSGCAHGGRGNAIYRVERRIAFFYAVGGRGFSR